MSQPRETKLYEILEVSVTCTDAELKKSYRRLSLIHHPDRQSASGSNTPVDHSKFQEIQNAYETLSDPDSRARYDRFGSDAGSGRGGGGGMDMDEDDLMNAFFGGGFPPGMGGGMGGGGPKRKAAKRQTEASRVGLTVTLEELYNGKEKKIEIERTRKCSGCKGTGAKPKTKPRPCVKCQGQGVFYVMQQMGPFVSRQLATCPSCHGEGTKVRDQDACKKCQATRITTEKKRIEVVVERGMRPGESICLKGEGDESPDSSAPGDLYITLSVAPHPSFTLSPTSPLDIHTTISVTLSEALLGFHRLAIVHLDRRGLKVTQPGPGEKGWRVLKTGDQVIIKGEGMWCKGERGDLVCKVEVEMPAVDWANGLEAEQIEALGKLLPPKRADIEHDGETDEVDLEDFAARTNGGRNAKSSGTRRPTDEDEEEDDDGGRPGCHQQ